MDSNSCAAWPNVTFFCIYFLIFLILYLPRFNKPVALTGFGLVTQNNAPNFVPFNSTQAPFGPDPRMSIISSFLRKMLILLGCSPIYYGSCTYSYTVLWCHRCTKRWCLCPMAKWFDLTLFMYHIKIWIYFSVKQLVCKVAWVAWTSIRYMVFFRYILYPVAHLL